MKDIIKNQIIELIKQNGLECIIFDDNIAVRKEGRTLFLIEIKPVKKPEDNIEIIPELLLF